MTWIIIISSLIAFLLWILLVPVIIFLDTDTSRYHLVLPGIFKAVVVPSTDIFYIRVWIFFIPFRIRPFRGKSGKRKEKTRKPGRKWQLKKVTGGKQMISSMIRSIRIRKLSLDIDTDDFLLNAWLVPLFSSMNSENIQMRVNFEGSSSLLLDLRGRIGNLLWIVISTKYKSFLNF
jgi:hypothetical protein